MLNLSRNIGLLTGSAVMGAVFAFGSAISDTHLAAPDAVATGMRMTFVFAALLIGVALAFAFGTRARRAVNRVTRVFAAS